MSAALLPPPPPSTLPTIARLRARLDAAPPGARRRLIEAVLARARQPEAAAVHTALFEAEALAAADVADAADAVLAAGRSSQPRLPLAGLPVSIKALFDVAGHVTHAGAALRRDAAPAASDAPAVARLRAAGAALIGHANMTEFAFSGVGLNPHFGTPRNPVDMAVARIPGGSSSGAAVAVAMGLAVAGLGSDTAGSIRVPAALCGLVGFKSTQRRVPLAGCYPLAPSLDTVCAMSRSVADAIAVDAVIADEPLQVVPRTLAGLRLAVPGTLMLDALEPAVATAFERALQRLSAAGAHIVDAVLPELAEIVAINQPGGLSPIEAYAHHREALATRRERFDPRVAQRVLQGEGVSAADYLRLLQRRAEWIRRMGQTLAGFDALLSPTVPLLAPPIAALVDDDAAFFRTNGLLLRNTLVANFLDGCAITLPMHAPGELPTGLMLTAPGGRDAALLGAALAVEAALAPLRGAGPAEP